jgi:hypothetical protein
MVRHGLLQITIRRLLELNNFLTMSNTNIKTVLVSKEITNKDDLLKSLHSELILPSYFGFNWDALSDCLKDFHWLKETEINIIHESGFKLEPKDMAVYFGILKDAIKSWDGSKDHTLKIFFDNKSI